MLFIYFSKFILDKSDKKKNKKQMPSPLPSLGQAAAFNKTKKRTPLTPEQIEQRKQKMIQDLERHENE
jgi:hypothetical protein